MSESGMKRTEKETEINHDNNRNEGTIKLVGEYSEMCMVFMFY